MKSRFAGLCLLCFSCPAWRLRRRLDDHGNIQEKAHDENDAIPTDADSLMLLGWQHDDRGHGPGAPCAKQGAEGGRPLQT